VANHQALLCDIFWALQPVRAKRILFCLASCILSAAGKAADFTDGSPATIPFTRQYDFTSKINGLGYRVWISSPTKVDPSRAYPIIYGLDGNSIAGMAFKREDEGRVEPSAGLHRISDRRIRRTPDAQIP
jgi:hypothetical protein